jgi:hypothetical protein
MLGELYGQVYSYKKTDIVQGAICIGPWATRSDSAFIFQYPQ